MFTSRFPTILAAILLVACSGDPPLLATDLPRGYAFESNGGEHGFLRGPDGLWLSEHFGMRNDGSERWCREFGWSGGVIVCRLEHHTAAAQPQELGYFVLDTATATVEIAPDETGLHAVLRLHGVETVPALATRHATTHRRD